jgi:hypothetical protein
MEALGQAYGSAVVASTVGRVWGWLELGSPTRVLSIDGWAATVSIVKHGHRPPDDTNGIAKY